MGKRRTMDDVPSNSPPPEEQPTAGTPAEAADRPLGPAGVAGPAGGIAGPLGDAMQDFLSRREELARRLQEEIAATELRLAELRRAVAQLFPEQAERPKPGKKGRSPGKSRPKELRGGGEGETGGGEIS